MKKLEEALEKYLETDTDSDGNKIFPLSKWLPAIELEQMDHAIATTPSIQSIKNPILQLKAAYKIVTSKSWKKV